jgi:hypothetical protein
MTESRDEQVARQLWFAHFQGRAASFSEKVTPAVWSLLADEASRHELSSLTYRVVTDGPLADTVPPEIQQRLRVPYLQSAVRNALLLRQTAAAAAELGRQGVPVMLLKGIHLARFVYAEPALRSMADVDIMVPRDKLAAGEKVFLDQGFGPLPRPDIEQFCSWSNHLAKLYKPDAPVVELHWAIERPTSPFSIDHDELWKRSRSAQLEGAAIQLLCPEDLLLHLALHGSYHHGFDRAGLKALLDVNAVVAKHGEELDWRALADRANRWGASGFVYTTLRLAGETLGTPIPSVVLDALQHRPEDEEVVEVASRFVVLPEVQLPRAYLAVARSPGLGERLRLISRAVLLPRESMERVYRLRAGSPLVYPAYLWRVLDLLARRGRLGLSSLFRTRSVQPALERKEDQSRIASWVKESSGKGNPVSRSDSAAPASVRDGK